MTEIANYTAQGKNVWYFFTPRDKKYPKGKRPSRAAGSGYWKATGADETVIRCGTIIGSKKALVFYLGRPPHGQKTDWIMYEYRAEGPSVVKQREGVEGLSMRVRNYFSRKLCLSPCFSEPNSSKLNEPGK